MEYLISVYSKELRVNWVKRNPNGQYAIRSKYNGKSVTNETIVTDGVIIDSDVKDLLSPRTGNACWDNLETTQVKDASFVIQYDRALNWGTFYSLKPPQEGQVYEDTRRIPGINWPVANN